MYVFSVALRSRSNRIGLVVFGLAAAVLTVSHVTNAAQRQFESVAVLFFEDRCSSGELASWRYGVTAVLSENLRRAGDLRAVSTSRVSFVLRRFGLTAGDHVGLQDARLMGAALGVDQVVFGSYTQSELIEVSFSVLDLRKAGSPRTSNVRGREWATTLTLLEASVYSALTSEASVQHPASRPWTQSQRCLDNLFAVIAKTVEQRSPNHEKVSLVREAISADPRCAKAHGMMGMLLVAEGQHEAARRHIIEALSLDPNEMHGLQARCQVNLRERKLAEAEGAIRHALQVDPENIVSLIPLGEICRQRRAEDQALEAWSKARSLARIAQVYARRGERNASLLLLAEAERLPRYSPYDAQSMFMSYYFLKEPDSALRHYSSFVRLATPLELSPLVMQQFEDLAKGIRAQLRTVPVSSVTPGSYSVSEFSAAVERTLSSTLRSSGPSNPLDGNQALQAWVRERTDAASEPMEKMRSLFEAICERSQKQRSDPYAVPVRCRQSIEVFGNWKDLQDSFSWNEYARLLVAMARQIDLQAFCVAVDRDLRGIPVDHLCAGVLLRGDFLLLDPRYYWFGIPHKEFSALDDLQAFSLFLLEESESPSVRQCQAAVEIDKESARSWRRLSLALAGSGDLDSAFKAFEVARKLKPESWQVRALRGYLLAESSEYSEAERYLRLAAEENSGNAATRLVLAKLLRKQGKLAEALEQFKQIARFAGEPGLVREASAAVMEIERDLAR